jgi:hypothetical protein
MVEHGAGVRGWFVAAYVTVSACEFGVAGIFFLDWATIFRAARSLRTMNAADLVVFAFFVSRYALFGCRKAQWDSF